MTVQRRRVFYIPGYDPSHPRRYRELYRTEAHAQAEISGYEITQHLKPGKRYGWSVTGQTDGATVEVDIDVLVWSDIVRESMSLGIAQTYLLMLRTAWIYISSGALWRMMGLRKGPVIAALLPVAVLVLQLLVGLLLAALLIWLGDMVLVPVIGVFGAVIGWGAGLLACFAVLRWFKAKDRKFFLAHYLMQDYGFSAAYRGANPPELEARMVLFGDEIAEALRTDVDEVLVVGHSSGAHLAVSILSDLARDGRIPEGGPDLSFLSLGQVVPMVSFLPKAHRLRADLQYLSTTPIPWVDVTAPGDGCAFALCDPVAVSGVATEDKRWPLVMSAAFTKTLSARRWKELRWKFFRLHFQYLCAFDRPGDYDYFQITAGPLTLGARYKDRAPSQSRIERVVSPHRSVTA